MWLSAIIGRSGVSRLRGRIMAHGVSGRVFGVRWMNHRTGRGTGGGIRASPGILCPEISRSSRWFRSYQRERVASRGTTTLPSSVIHTERAPYVPTDSLQLEYRNHLRRPREHSIRTAGSPGGVMTMYAIRVKQRQAPRFFLSTAHGRTIRQYDRAASPLEGFYYGRASKRVPQSVQ